MLIKRGKGLENNRFEVKRLSKADVTEIEWLLKEVWPKAHEYPKEWRNARMMNKNDIFKEMKSGIQYFGIKVKGKVIGCYKATIVEDGIVGEHQSVHPQYRKRGMAEAMYKQLMRLAKEIGCKKILVNVLPNQPASKRIVKKYGFIKTREYEQIPGMLVQLYELIL